MNYLAKVARKNEVFKKDYDNLLSDYLDAFNRWQALKRHPDYLMFYKQRNKLAEKEKKETMSRFGLNVSYLVQPLDPGKNVQTVHYYFKDNEKTQKLDLSNEQVFYDYPIFMDTHAIRPLSPFDHSRQLFSDSISVEINLRVGETRILKELKSLLKTLKYFQGKKRSGNRETKLDPWEIYDKVKAGQSPLQVTKQKFGLTENPAYNFESDNCYHQVRRAFNKACEMVKSVSPDRYDPTKR